MLLNELIDPHVSAANPHHQFIRHDLSVYFLTAKHIKPIAKSGDRQLNPSQIDVFS